MTSIPDILSGELRAGLLGRGILASGSPWLHEKEAKAVGLDLTYVLYDFTERGWADDFLGDALENAQREGCCGLNITFPFKQSVIPFLDELTDNAVRVGAVNTVEMIGGRLIGHNTDITGFASGFLESLPGADLANVLQIGCGGAGSATAHALLGIVGVDKLVLADSDLVRRNGLYQSLVETYGQAKVAVADDPSAAAQSASGIVNATPMGMEKFPGMPLPPQAIEARHWVADIVYFPLETQLLESARLKGCRTLNGSGMVIHQAAEAFEIFVKRRADPVRMRRSFNEFLRHKGEVR